MSAKAIREYHGKRLVSKWISEYGDYDVENRVVQVGLFGVHVESLWYDVDIFHHMFFARVVC